MPVIEVKPPPPKPAPPRPKPEGLSWDAFNDLTSGRRTCGDVTCPDPYCWMEYDE